MFWTPASALSSCHVRAARPRKSRRARVRRSRVGEAMNIELPREAPDVLVVGAGNAALCAAISAHENGARVLMLEAAPYEERGGNSHFTGGAFRFAFRGV